MSSKVFLSVDPADLTLPRFDVPEGFAQEFNENYSLRDKVTGIDFAARFFNADKLRRSKSIVVDILPFTQTFSSPLVEDTYTEFAAVACDYPILCVSIELTKLNSSQLEDMKRVGLSYLTGALARAVAERFEQRKLILTGASFGGAFVANLASMAPQHKLHVEGLALRDPAGIKPQNYVTQALSFVRDAGYDNKLQPHKKDDTKFKALTRKNKILARQLRLGSLSHDIFKALQFYPDVYFHLSYGENNLICPKKDIMKLVTQIERKNFSGDLELLEIKDYGHYRGKYNRELSFLFGAIIRQDLIEYILPVAKPLPISTI
jgi:hypothetical protein